MGAFAVVVVVVVVVVVCCCCCCLLLSVDLWDESLLSFAVTLRWLYCFVCRNIYRTLIFAFFPLMIIISNVVALCLLRELSYMWLCH